MFSLVYFLRVKSDTEHVIHYISDLSLDIKFRIYLYIKYFFDLYENIFIILICIVKSKVKVIIKNNMWAMERIVDIYG
jgi:hypothetical protein